MEPRAPPHAVRFSAAEKNGMLLRSSDCASSFRKNFKTCATAPNCSYPPKDWWPQRCASRLRRAAVKVDLRMPKAPGVLFPTESGGGGGSYVQALDRVLSFSVGLITPERPIRQQLCT